ncbi:MAG: DUF4175 family protein [Bacteroidales bacterium]|nr:DUF4175 family protein [Bacteroidales bacterium]
MPTESNIVDKLDRFIRKYYKNRLLKGALLAVALLVGLYLVMVLLEHFGWFGTGVRTLLFWGFIAATVAVLAYYVVTPLLKMRGLGRRISYDEAARIIGEHFPEVKDKLLNLLQLQSSQAGGATPDGASAELLRASIDQKTASLSPVPFQKAIDLSKNRRYVKYAAIPLVLLVAGLLIAPSLITDPSQRLLNHNTQYERPAPFTFVLENSDLTATQQDDYTVRVALEGDAIPKDVSIVVEGTTLRMQQVDKLHYSYTFKNIQRSQRFHFSAVGVNSAEYEVEVNPKPAVVAFQATVTYPAYIGRDAETFSNNGDLVVPKGSRIAWSFQTKDADSLAFLVGDSNAWRAMAMQPNANGRTTHTLRANTSFQYAFCVSNRYVDSDTIGYAVSVIEDAYPMIVVMSMTDSTAPDRLFFRGNIKDDYGFAKLEFVIERTNVRDTSQHSRELRQIAITGEASQEFYYSLDFSTLEQEPGDEFKYWFRVWDNDGVNGSKMTESNSFATHVPTEEEIDDIIQSRSDDIRQQGELSMNELRKLQEEINDLMRKLVDKKELTWQDKKQLEELQKKQQEVKEMLQQMRNQMQENNRMEEKYREQSEQIIEKQKELDKLFDQVMSDEIKEMMKEMEKLMNEMDKKKVQEELENLKMKNEDLEKQLDQNIELMKRLELEKKVEQAVNKAEELGKKQAELSEKSEQKGADKEQLMKEQQKLSEQFQELKKDIDQIQKDYKNLSDPQDFKVSEELQKSIEQNQQNAQNQLNKGKQKDASKSQKEAAEKLEQLSEQLAQEQMDMEQEELSEDAEEVRRLLKNLVQLSIDQESLIGTLNTVSINDPKYQQIIVDQNKIKSDFRNVEDSLRALARRQIKVAAMVNKELGEVNSNMSKSLSGLLEFNQSFYANYRNTQSARSMQYTMTSLNNLALVLAESLDQMQNQMRQNQQQKKSGSCKRTGKKSGSCSNPGKGKPSPKSMRQMQEELNKQMKQLKEELDKKGNKPGSRTKIGDHNTMSSEFARMAAQQEQIRRMMQEYGQELKQQNAGNSKLAKEIDEMMKQMEQTETDLVNKTITKQTINRQQQILTRLLQHEKAEMQREKEERRESREAQEQYQPSQGDLEKYQRLQEQNIELFHTTPPNMNNFYKNKVNGYFFKF